MMQAVGTAADFALYSIIPSSGQYLFKVVKLSTLCGSSLAETGIVMIRSGERRYCAELRVHKQGESSDMPQ